MSGGRDGTLAKRRRNKAYKEWQTRVLNILRLEYWHSPIKLKACGVKGKITDAQIASLLWFRGRSTPNARHVPVLTMLTDPKRRTISAFRIVDSEARAVLDDTYERIAERMPFPIERHRRFVVPSKSLEDVWAYYNKRTIKAEKNFKEFLERTIILQNFELYRESERSGERNTDINLIDRDIAQAIYFDANDITEKMLAHVRQLRKRLKKYSLL